MDTLNQHHLNPAIVLWSLEEINVPHEFMWMMSPEQKNVSPEGQVAYHKSKNVLVAFNIK
eukprot:6234539-Amphidinium_carterae.1